MYVLPFAVHVAEKCVMNLMMPWIGLRSTLCKTSDFHEQLHAVFYISKYKFARRVMSYEYHPVHD